MRALVLLFLLLAGCGGGSPSPAAVATVPADSVVAVTVNEDKSQGGELLQDVTFRTGDGREFRVECCDVEVHLGDTVKVMPYGVANWILFVNKVQVDVLVDWPAMEEHIRTFDPERAKAGEYDVGMEEVRAYILEGELAEASP